MINFVTTKKGILNNLEIGSCYNLKCDNGYMKTLNKAEYKFKKDN